MEERIGDARRRSIERSTGLRTWVAHEGAGLRVFPQDPVVPDATVIAVTTIGPMRMAAPCRIVAVFKELGLFGFSYGTLPGHPETRGRELRRSSGAAERRTSCVRAFSRPVDPLARLAGPLGRAVQRSVTRRYVNGPAALRRVGDRFAIRLNVASVTAS